jgi:hypothetical protein
MRATIVSASVKLSFGSRRILTEVLPALAETSQLARRSGRKPLQR